MLVEKNVDGAEDMVQVALYEDPELTELNALQVSMDLLYLGHKAQRIVCTQKQQHTESKAHRI